MTADEMFKALGYTNKSDDFRNDDKIFKYILPLEDSNFDREKCIVFWEDKTVSVAVFEYDIEDNLKDVYPWDITSQEIKVIYQKLKELGWIE